MRSHNFSCSYHNSPRIHFRQALRRTLIPNSQRISRARFECVPYADSYRYRLYFDRTASYKLYQKTKKQWFMTKIILFVFFELFSSLFPFQSLTIP